MALKIYYNPLDTACKSVIGAVSQNETVRFNVFLRNPNNEMLWQASYQTETRETPLKENCLAPSNNAFLLLKRDGQDVQSYLMEKTAYGWSISISIAEIGLFFYAFSIEGEGFVSRGDLEMGDISQQPNYFLLTVYANDYQTPDWFKGGVMYQIFPDRFFKIGTTPDIKGRVFRADWGGTPSYKPNENGKVLNNDFFGGNFKGIQSKLPYLKELGVTVVYLNPIFEAASNHRYDTSDYMRVDPVLGTEEDFANLVNAGKEIGISFILDGVFNHTGDDSVYFNKYGHYPSLGAYQSTNSPYYSWYTFTEFPHKYESWWGIDILPQVNEKSKEYQDFIFGEKGVLRKWLQFGIGGYRLDVADELPDFFLKNLRKSVKKGNPEAIIIGEVWEDASDKIAYSERREYLQGYELDSVMNYPLKEAIIQYVLSENALTLLRCIRALIDHYPKQTLDCLMNILGTHDTSRILTVLGGIICHNKDEMSSPNAYLSENAKEKAIQKLKIAAVLQYTCPGVPCVYYGDENGMEGHIDPFCRRCFNWDNRNEELFAFYKKLGEIRERNKEIFKDGEFKEISTSGGLLIFARKNTHGTIYVVLNNSSKSFSLDLPENFVELFSDIVYKTEMTIRPYAYAILKSIETH